MTEKFVVVGENMTDDEKISRMRKATEEMGRLALKSMGHTDTCPECGTDIWMEMFWMDMDDKAYRVCPNCDKIIYE